jgi:IPT/TIG domain/PA14 domain
LALIVHGEQGSFYYISSTPYFIFHTQFYKTYNFLTFYLFLFLSPAINEFVPVAVAIVQQDMTALYAKCPTPSSCQFQYRSDRTPQGAFVSRGGVANSTFLANGRFMNGAAFSSSNVDISIGGATCDLADELFANPASIGASSDPWGNGNVRCYAGDIEAGKYNVTFNLYDPVEGYGDAFWARDAWMVDTTSGGIYQYVLTPAITSIQWAFSYVDRTGNNMPAFVSGGLGGSDLIISGTGFSWTPSNNIVTLGNVPCVVKSSTLNTIVCTVQPSPSLGFSPSYNASVLYPGGRGMVHKVWYGTSSFASIGSIAPSVYVDENALVSKSWNEVSTSYVEELTGFFVPPVSAVYSFYLRGDDAVTLELSTDSNPSNLKTLANMGSPSNYFALNSNQISSNVSLVAGTPYYMRVRHSQISGSDFFDVGIRIFESSNPAGVAAAGLTLGRQYNSLAAVYKVSITSNVVREVQTFSLSGADGGAFTVSFPGQVIPSPAPGALPSYPSIPFNDDGTALRNAIGNLGGRCGSISVTYSNFVTSSNATGRSWNITINCPSSAPYPTLMFTSLSLRPAAGQNVFLSSSSSVVVTKSVPVSGAFSFMFGSDVTPQISTSASGASMMMALNSMPSFGGDIIQVTDSWTNTMDGGTWLITNYKPGLSTSSVLSVNLLDANLSSTVFGSNVQVTVTAIHAPSSDPFLWPAPMDYFRTAVPLPSVIVTSNGISSMCDHTGVNASLGVFPCTFRYDDSLTPSIISVSSNSITAGTVLTITGAGFIADPNLNKVYLNTSFCNVTAATTTALTCTVLAAPAGSYDLRVEVGNGRGFAKYSNVLDLAIDWRPRWWLRHYNYRLRLRERPPLQLHHGWRTSLHHHLSRFLLSRTLLNPSRCNSRNQLKRASGRERNHLRLQLLV